MSFWNTLTSFWRRDAVEREMAEEMQLHQEQQYERNVAAGMTADEARRAVRREFGHLDKIREEARDAQRPRALHDVVQDFRFALRMLMKRPGFTVAAVFTLALGIGFVTTIFTVINGVVLGRLPFPQSHRIVSVGVPSLSFDELARTQSSLEGFALASSQSANLRAGDAVARYDGAAVSANFLEALQTQPIIGRTFVAADEAPGAVGTIIVGQKLWREFLAGDPNVLGREIWFNGEVRTVIGVMAEGFGFPRHATWWVPRATQASLGGAQVYGRLRPGVSAQEASSEFSALLVRLTAGNANASQRPSVVEVVTFARQGLKDAVRVVLLAVWGATFLVLLLACANVTNLVLARASERGKELAIRCAVGATRGRLIRQMLTESFVISSLGAAGGALIAWWSTKLLWDAIAPEAALTGGMPFWVSFDLDARVLTVLVFASLLATVLTGLTPALKASRINLSEGIKQGGGTGLTVSRLTRFLINVQMALSVCLVTGAALFLTVLIAFNQKRLSYDPSAVLAARISLEDTRYVDPAGRESFLNELLARVRAIPGVDGVAVTSSRSLRPVGRAIENEGHTYAEGRRPTVWVETVDPAYLELLGGRLVEGRGLSANDGPDTVPVALVNSAYAETFSDKQSMLGKRVRMAGTEGAPEWLTIVGVTTELGSMKAGQGSNGPTIYRPWRQDPTKVITLLLRGSGDATRLADPLRKIIVGLDPQLPISEVHTIQTIIELERIGINVPGILFIVCGIGALLLAAVGVYGVVSFSVKVRMREFGVRLALGATPGDVIRHVLRQGLRQISIGLGTGLLLALALSAVLTSTFSGFGRSAYDGWIYLSVVLLLGAVGVAALWIPARRGSRADPMIALRAE